MSWPPQEAEIENFNDLEGIDTDRARILLRDATNNGIASGITIMQKVELHNTNSMHGPTGDILTDLEMRMDDNQIVATDTTNGRKRIELTVNHIAMAVSASMNGQKLVDTHYDSDTDGAGLDSAYGALKEIIGHKTIIEIDEHGNAVQTSEHEALFDAMSSGDNADTMQQFSSENQFDQINRMTKALPEDNLVEPGDKWDFEMQMDSAFNGSAVLLGYKEYDTSDCAIIKFDGGINFDSDHLNEITQMMGAEIKDGKMSAILYWGHEKQLARFSKTMVTMTMSVSNPLDPSMNIEIPNEEMIIVYSTIVN